MADPMEDAMMRRAAVRAGAQAAAPGVQPTPATASDAPAMSMEDAMAARAKARAGGGAPPIPPPPGGGGRGQTDTQPGFWSKTYDATLRPFVDQPGQNIGGIIGGVIGAPGYLGVLRARLIGLAQPHSEVRQAKLLRISFVKPS